MIKSQKAKNLSVNTLLFTISNFGTKIISFLLVPLYTYVLSTTDYGNLDLITTTVQLLIPIMTLNIQDAVLRFGLDKEYNPMQSAKVGFRVIAIASFILGAVLFVLFELPFFPLSAMYSLYLYLLFVTHAFYNVLSMFLKAINKVKLLVICGLLNTLIACSLNILLLLVYKLGVLGYLIANISGTVIAVAIMFFGSGIIKSAKTTIPSHLFKTMALFSLSLVANSIAWWLNNASDRYILVLFSGAAITGVYAVAYKIPTILSTIQSIFYNAWSISAITEFDEEDSDGFIGNVYMTYYCVSIVGCSILLLCNIFIAKMLYAKEFFEAWHYVPPLLVGTVFNGIALFEGCVFTAVKKTKDVSVTTVLGAVINTVFNFALIPFIGALGASIATMIGYISIWIIRTCQMRKIIRIKVDWVVQIFGFIVLFIQCGVALMAKHFYWQIPLAIVLIFSQRKYLIKIAFLFKNKTKKR